jgi:hypothetical protein
MIRQPALVILGIVPERVLSEVEAYCSNSVQQQEYKLSLRPGTIQI